MKVTKRFAAAALAGIALTMTMPQAAMAADSTDSIRIVTNDWTSQLVLSNIVGQILQSIGDNVEYKSSDSQLQFTAMANNDMDFQVEVWEGSMAQSFDKAKTQGLVDLGKHEAVTREDWWYPDYVKDVCPGLPDWHALNQCAAKFATAETGGKGRFVGPPADWGKHYSERIHALNMNFQEVAVGQAATLWAELQSATDRKEPIVLFNWTPNFIEAKFKGEFVDFPDPSSNPKCATQPEFCGAPKNGYLKKAASPELEKKWPKAFAVLQKVNFTNPVIAKAAAMVDVDGMTPEDAAKKWVAENEATWKPWVQ